MAGGDRINYPDLLTVKLVLNSIISTPGADVFTMDIRNFYLNTHIARNEYLRLKMSDMPDDFIEEENLCDKAMKDEFVDGET